MCVVNSRIESACVLIVNVDAFRYSGEFDALGLTIICERSLIVPLYAGHVNDLLPDSPVKCHVFRSEIVVCIRVDEHGDSLVITGGYADLIAVSDSEFFRNSLKSNFVCLAVKIERLVIAPSYGAHVI